MMPLPTFLALQGLVKPFRPRLPGPGVQRAAKRLAMKRRMNGAIPDAERYTRQQARRERLKLMKELRAEAKAEAIVARMSRRGYR